jgi:hypothetical protein
MAGESDAKAARRASWALVERVPKRAPRFLTGTETLLAQIDAGGIPVGRHPCRPPEHGKVVVDGFRMLGSMG